MEHIHESPPVMTLPLIVLAIGAVFAGWLGYQYFGGDLRDAFWGAALFVAEGNDTIEGAHHVPIWVKLLPIIVTVAGIGLAYVMYMFVPGLPTRLASSFRPIYLFLLNKWSFDELYDYIFVRPAMKLGRVFWKGGDGAIIDGFGPNGASLLTKRAAVRAGKMQSGYVYHYAFAMMVGVVAIISWYMLMGGT